ncbi:hypothetical protein LINPERHAP2_LOCUS29608 [Linum perenne]
MSRRVTLLYVLHWTTPHWWSHPPVYQLRATPHWQDHPPATTNNSYKQNHSYSIIPQPSYTRYYIQSIKHQG